MITVTTKLMTANELYEWSHQPENRNRDCELERGRIVEVSRPGIEHGLICGNVARILGNYTVQVRRGYVCANDTGVVVERDPDTVRGPDILLNDDEEDTEVVKKYAERPPLLAVEVLLPNDTYSSVFGRVQEQLLFGTKIVWILDPDARTVVIHYPDDRDRVVREEDILTGNDVLPGFQCRVADFYLRPHQLPQPQPAKPQPRPTRKRKKGDNP